MYPDEYFGKKVKIALLLLILGIVFVILGMEFTRDAPLKVE